MIEKMKKYSFLIYHKTYDEFLESIRQQGVVHIVEKQKGVPYEAIDLRKQLATAGLLKNAILSLQHRLNEQKDVVLQPLDVSANGMDALTAYEELKKQEEQLKAQQLTLQKEIDSIKVWGNFEPGIVQKLRESCGRQIKFFSCRESEFKPEWKEKFDAVEVTRAGVMIYFLTFTDIELEEEPDADKMRISGWSLHQLYEALQENQNQMAELEKQFDLLAIENLNNLKEAHRQMSEHIDLNKVHLQAEKKADEKLILLEGWIPEVKDPELIRALETQDVYYISETPGKDDKTMPVLLKNNKFSRLFEPIGEMYSLPNYHELDLTPFFAPFYMLFFGLCLGDTGYGILVLLGALFARRKVQPSLKPIMSLAALMGTATIICGFFTGTLFGIPLLQQDWAWLASFKQFMVDDKQMFNIALVLGGVQVLFGMFVRACGAVRRYGWAYSLERWGWLILLIGGGSMYLVFNSDKEILPPDTARYIVYAVLGVACLFIFVLNDPKRNPLINIGVGLWNTFNMATGLIGDLLSYIRLFALGLSGSVMGLVFNQLAMELSGDIPVVSQLVMLFILLFGHSINIFMSSIGAFVHPLRLTFVEFYKNAGFEGGGKPYKPFRYIPVEES
jgi:V/A-type H+-transporting ATPase subunit I